MKKSIAITVLVVFAFMHLSAHKFAPTIVGVWKLTKSEALDNIKNSTGYASMPEESIKKFEAHSDLLMQVCEYNFQPENKLVYMDVEQSFIGVSLPVERHAVWELKNDVITIKETDRPYERQMKIVTLNDSALIVNPIIKGEVSKAKLVFKLKR